MLASYFYIFYYKLFVFNKVIPKMASGDELSDVDSIQQLHKYGTSDSEEAVELLCDDFASSQKTGSERLKLISTSTEQLNHKWNSKGWLIALTCISAIGGALFGYDTGVVSGAVILIDERCLARTNCKCYCGSSRDISISIWYPQ